MPHPNKKSACLPLLTLLLALTCASCASAPELKVLYQLPAPSEALRGMRVEVRVEDLRPSRDLLGKGASLEFEGFMNNMTFSVARYNEPAFKIGVLDVKDLVTDAFRRRLRDLGGVPVEAGAKGDVEIRISVREFFLDLRDRTWMGRVAYEAQVRAGGRIAATQIVTGQAERYKVFGHTQAEEVMGEIVTDTVNRLDMVDLLLKAKAVSS